MAFAQRRERFLALLADPVVLFAGGSIGRNYPRNPYPYRADSSFHYFFESPEPGSAALFDPQAGTVTLFLPPRTIEDALWHGVQEPFEAACARHGVAAVASADELEVEVRARAKGRPVRALAVADAATTARARALTGEDLAFEVPPRVGHPEVVDAIASLRLRKGPEELAEQRRLVPITREAHEVAMRHSRAGVSEQLLTGLVEGAFARHGCVPAYNTILSVRGEVLHNLDHGNLLQPGDVVLCDAGPEAASTGYCNDVTRCWPVGGRFTPEARDVYQLVLQAELHAIAQVRPGVRFRDLHLAAARVLAEGLVALGLLQGDPDGLVEQGAHAVFFPHGLGHQLGLDVHDLEAFGDRVHYPDGRTRSPQFGTAFLRMDLDLAPGMTFTVEPGLYFAPAILTHPDLRARFARAVRWDVAERYLGLNQGRGLGGIRIEDDVLCTETGSEVLTHAIPRSLADIEALAGST
jgi:Xaa-Pro aminopeptidase